MPSQPVLEMAIFTVREPDLFPAIQRRTHADLATLTGHRAGLRLRGRTNAWFADLVAWDSLEAAQQASNVVREDPRFVGLISSIAELKLYAHYRLDESTEVLLGDLGRAPVVEVAAYAVRDVRAHLEIHGRLHQALRSVTGHRSGAPAQQVEDPRQLADLLGWEDISAHERAQATMRARDDLAPFFSGIAEMKVFELFSVLA